MIYFYILLIILLSLLSSTKVFPSWQYAEYVHLAGSKDLTEVLLGKRFRATPQSFLQINSKGAEVLYETIGTLLKLTDSTKTTLLDIGCGVGVIGIILSDKFHRVIGIDRVQASIDCAQVNARLNNINNIQFVCTKAHRLHHDALQDVKPNEDIIVVVNPSRVGLRKEVMFGMRSNPAIKQLIYISCKPSGNVLINFASLLHPESEKFPGKPFVAEKAVAVDMFPHTAHCELIVSFVR